MKANYVYATSEEFTMLKCKLVMLVREAGLSTPGYRLDALRNKLLAGEYPLTRQALLGLDVSTQSKRTLRTWALSILRS